MGNWNYIEEYRELSEEVRHRGQENATVQSILITGSLLAVTFALQEGPQIGRPFTLFIIVVAIFLALSAASLAYTTRKLDNIFMERIKAIETRLPIEIGHSGLSGKILGTGWYRLRRVTWYLIIVPLLIFYLYALVMNISAPLPGLGLEEIGILLAILGVFLAIAVPVMFEHWKKPDLEIIPIDERGNGTTQFKFVHIKVVNKPHRFLRFIERNFANEAKAQITFVDRSSGTILFTMPCKWTSKPEPVTLIHNPQAGTPVYVLDVTKIRDAESINIPPGKDGEALDVAIKYKGEKECYGFNSLSYHPRAQPGWKDPDKKISSSECLLRIVVTSGEVSKAKDLALKNLGIDLDNFVCT